MTRRSLGLALERDGPTGRDPVVLVHAGVADRRMWDASWPTLVAHRDCLRVDLRGFGESTSRPPQALDHVADLVGVLDDLEVDRGHLVGSSFGAGVAVETALAAPDRASSILLCPPGGSLLAELTPDLAAFFATENQALETGDLDAAVQANVDTWLVGPSRGAEAVDPAARELVKRMQRRAFELTADWDDLDEVELDPPALERLGEVGCPVLVLLGGHDLDTTADAADRLAAELGDVRRLDWPDVAHLPPVERPEAFARLLLDWVDETEPVPPS